jgi:hypothetical protein
MQGVKRRTMREEKKNEMQRKRKGGNEISREEYDRDGVTEK